MYIKRDCHVGRMVISWSFSFYILNVSQMCQDWKKGEPSHQCPLVGWAKWDLMWKEQAVIIGLPIPF